MKLQQSVLGSEERRRSSLADGPLMALSNFGPPPVHGTLQHVVVTIHLSCLFSYLGLVCLFSFFLSFLKNIWILLTHISGAL